MFHCTVSLLLLAYKYWIVVGVYFDRERARKVEMYEWECFYVDKVEDSAGDVSLSSGICSFVSVILKVEFN